MQTDQDAKLERIIAIIRDECWKTIAEQSEMSKNNSCAPIFDGFYCWNRTEAGQLAEQFCTNRFIISKNKAGNVTKQCTDNGTWYMKADRSWLNLTQCDTINFVDVEAQLEAVRVADDYEKWSVFMGQALYLGYGLSTLALVTALVIFITLKRLHCERNKLHINLFISHLCRAAMFIIKDRVFVHGITMPKDITYDGYGRADVRCGWTGKMLVSVQWYVSLVNYLFMMMEGLYLHNLIFLNLYSQFHSTTTYCLLGWGVPLAFVVPWVFLRIHFEDTYCWTLQNNKYIQLLFDIPTAMTVIMNFILFMIILRVLIRKIHFTSLFVQRKLQKYRKLLKSTMILIPLYGVPYMFSLVLRSYQTKNQTLSLAWVFFDQTFTSFQGLFAALVYCLVNNDVQKEVSRKCESLRYRQGQEFKRRDRTISNNTQLSMQNNEDAIENLKLFGVVEEEVPPKYHNEILNTLT
ncbi:hypothetical protein ABEB36_011830 [Hypothenemus hampei]|uniref:Parathyroid hormone/parathyroid hormone-related peptide receptor n=1 Tax=Hypothenemus hampei TaxID=57062 RepID=A0ABD1EBU3_HYPHA